MPYFVAYVSSATELFSDEQLDELLVTCRRNNAARGVTGALLYQDGSFIQVIEGDEGVVKDLYDLIALDPRHRRVIVLVRGTTASRQFSRWEMAFSDLTGSDTALASDARRFLEDDDVQDGDSSGVGRRLLRSFRSTLEPRAR